MQRLFPLVMVVAITMIGAFLRFHDLAQVPLRGDEAFTVLYWARQPLNVSLTQTATIEPHPVLTYAIFHGWGLATGTSAFTMRLLPALVNLLGIPAVYVLGRRLTKTAGRAEGVGLLAALLFALHPFEIWHAQDARNNAIWAGLSAVTMCIGVMALEKPSRQRWTLYGLCAVLTANMFYFELLFLTTFGVYVFLARRRQFREWVMAALPAFVTSIASFVILQGALIASGSYAGTIASRFDFNLLLSTFLPVLSFGETLPADVSSALWPFIILALAAGLLAQSKLTPLSPLQRDKGSQNTVGAQHPGEFHSKRLFLPIMLLPVILFSAAALRFNIFTPRYLLPLVPIMILIFSGLVIGLLQRGWHRRDVSRPLSASRLNRGIALGGIALLIGWLSVAASTLNNYYTAPAYAKSRDWPALTEYLAANVSADDLVIQLSVDSAFGFYYNAAADDIALPGYPTQPADEIRAILAREATQRRSIWIVGQSFPDWPSAGIVEDWLQTHMQTGRAGMAADLNYRQFVPWDVAPDETGNVLATFGEVAELVGYQVFLPPAPSGHLTVWLYWRPVSSSEKPLKVFVHLLGEINPQTGTPLWSQDDQFPQDGLINTDSWETGRVYRDIYTLPLADVPAGEYMLHVGFYDPDTNERLTAGESDSYPLRALTVNVQQPTK